MQKYLYLLAFLIFSSSVIFFLQMNQVKVPHKKLSKQQRIEGAIKDRIFTSSDVDLGVVPYDKLFAAIKEGQKRAAQESGSRSLDGSLTEAIFRERGPRNVGGRTRAILIDESDPNRNRIWVGGVSGGLWRTEDVTQADPQWEKIGTTFENISIGDIAQDPNQLATFYVGTGESYTGFGGVGIFKTLDDGNSWTLLSSTSNGNFDYVNEIYVHTSSDVYVATNSGGLLRSVDGGLVWEKVLGSGLSGASNNNFHDITFNEVNQHFYASNSSSVFKSSNGNRGEWINIGTGKPGFPSNLNRVEVAVCPSDPEVIYVLGAIGGGASEVFISNNGGENWISRPSPSVPPYPGCPDIACGQAGYDLDIAADPFNCSHLVVGGITLWESAFQAVSWQKYIYESQTIGDYHYDQHTIYFDPKKQGRIYYGNDGGFFMSTNNGQSAEDKNLGYVTTQFYCGAIHPEAGSPYVIGGTQDNGSLQITQAGLSPANRVFFGDGIFCFIDQNEPDIQIVSSQEGNYGLSTDGGISFGLGASINGAFINRSGYDDSADLLYGQINEGGGNDVVDFFRWNIQNYQVDNVDISGFDIEVSAVKADPNEPNRIYFGGRNGQVIKVDNANTGTSVTGTVFADFPSTASVSCIYMDKQTSQDVLISLFNYGGSLENVWVTSDGGAQWQSIEGDLPDLPVNWAIFDPSDHDRVMIATDAGIWVTDDVDGDLTHWVPISPDNGMPFVEVNMLLMRESDKAVLAVTYGRGLMTTDIFSAPAAVILAQPIGYEGNPIVIDGSQSVNASDYLWSFGDNTTSTEPVVNHTYNDPGVYTITLTINGGLTKTQTITILPYLPSPYQVDSPGYAGDFETQPDHFVANNVQGTGFQRGVSTKPGKDGTNSGTNAWVLGINDNLYQNNTRAELYTPMYDLSEPGLYDFRFFGKFAIQNPHDGFQIEYSLDGGATWVQLGSNQNPNWYNYYNANLADGAFPMGKSYFTNAKLNWTQYIKDISFLAGQSQVSFRFGFRADPQEQAQGLAIDDVEITRYDGELKTTLTTFNAEYTGEKEVTLNWTTGIEFHCKEFQLERSYTGFGFTKLSTILAKGGTTTFPNSYSKVEPDLDEPIYYRLKVINEYPAVDTAFYSDTVVVRRDVEPDIVNILSPNPFSDHISISFTSIVEQEVSFRLFDAVGRLVLEEVVTPNSVVYTIDHLHLPVGVYILAVQVGDGDLKAYKLLSSGS